MSESEPTTSGRRRQGGLGRGLSALLGEVERERPVDGGGDSGVRMVAVSSITAHPDQPRRRFDEDALDELAQSIKLRGVIQPIVVRRKGEGYQIVAGERRWRAAQRAHLHDVPVIVRDFDEAETLEIAIIENIQREDLNAIEEAEAYRRLITDYGHTQEALGRLVHKSRSHITNLLRLLDLPDAVREMVGDGKLSMGHARALILAPEAVSLARRAIEEGLSVRQIEALVRGGRTPRSQGQASQSAAEPDADIRALERQLGDMIGLKVVIAHGADGGSVTLTYATLDQLDMICQRLSGDSI
jgi:ParB family chromosome partitioning protein